jgi:hypothetical protein
MADFCGWFFVAKTRLNNILCDFVVAFSTDKEYSERKHIANGTSNEPRELQLWTPDEDDHHANLLLETAGTGFSPDEMFQV